MSTSEIDELLRFGHEVVAEAGAIAARYFRHQVVVADKRGAAGFDPVTEADRGVEARIRERIAEGYPDHGVVGEEYGATSGSSSWSWIVDPIDGTRAFVMGLPVWGCLLGILRDGEPVGGLMHQPVVGETFSGNGESAWVTRGGERKRIEVRADAVLNEAVLVATHPSMFRGATLSRFEALAARVRMMRYGGDCYNYMPARARARGPGGRGPVAAVRHPAPGPHRSRGGRHRHGPRGANAAGRCHGDRRSQRAAASTGDGRDGWVRMMAHWRRGR